MYVQNTSFTSNTSATEQDTLYVRPNIQDEAETNEMPGATSIRCDAKVYRQENIGNVAVTICGINSPAALKRLG